MKRHQRNPTIFPLNSTSMEDNAVSGRLLNQGVLELAKRVLHWAGTLLAVAGVIFVGFRLREYSAGIDLARFSGQVIPSLTVLVCIYSLSNFMLALAWRHLLDLCGIHATRPWAVRTFGVSQLAKYVPGNIFHLAGRQAMGMADGISGWALARSTMWELGLLVLAGSIFGVLALPLIMPSFHGSWATGAFAIVVGMVGLGIGCFVGVPATRAFILYVGFLLVSGLLFVGLTGILTHAWGSLPWIGLVAGYVVAWLLGLITPGAPAGFGVREMVLMFLLKGLVTETDLLLAVVLGRVVTMGGDALFGAMAFLSNPRR